MHKQDRHASLIIVYSVAALFFNACAVTPHRPNVPSGAIPMTPVAFAPTAEAERFGQALSKHLESDYVIDSDSERYDRLMAIFEELADVANLNANAWHVQLFHDPEITNVRAVHGNYVFVWSGVFDVVESEDEIAGLLACELAHALAQHTAPVQFSVASEALFMIADLATTMGIAALTQGIISVNTPGLARRAYVEAADLDPLDRVYTDHEIEEMISVALAILAKSRYSPNALLAFWERVESDEALLKQVTPLVRKMPPRERIALLKAAMQKTPQRGSELTERKASTTPPLGALELDAQPTPKWN